MSKPWGINLFINTSFQISSYQSHKLIIHPGTWSSCLQKKKTNPFSVEPQTPELLPETGQNSRRHRYSKWFQILFLGLIGGAVVYFQNQICHQKFLRYLSITLSQSVDFAGTLATSGVQVPVLFPCFRVQCILRGSVDICRKGFRCFSVVLFLFLFRVLEC